MLFDVLIYFYTTLVMFCSVYYDLDLLNEKTAINAFEDIFVILIHFLMVLMDSDSFLMV